MTVFVAHGLKEGEPAREANEEIENLLVSWDEALDLVTRRFSEIQAMPSFFSS